MLRSVDFKFPTLSVSINTESGDIIHIVHMVAHKMKEFVDFKTRNSVKSQCMGKYSIINTINKKVLGHMFAIKSLGVGAMIDRGHLHPHFVKMGDGRFEDSGLFDGEIWYIFMYINICYMYSIFTINLWVFSIYLLLAIIPLSFYDNHTT